MFVISGVTKYFSKKVKNCRSGIKSPSFNIDSSPFKKFPSLSRVINPICSFSAPAVASHLSCFCLN